MVLAGWWAPLEEGHRGSGCWESVTLRRVGRVLKIYFHRPSWLTKEVNNGTEQNAAAAAKSLQSCLTLCDPIDGSPPGPAVPGILQARTLEGARRGSQWIPGGGLLLEPLF